MKLKLKLNSIVSPSICGDDRKKRKVWEKVGSRTYHLGEFNGTNQKSFRSGEIQVKLDVNNVLKAIDEIIEYQDNKSLSHELNKEKSIIEIEVVRLKSGSTEAIDEEIVNCLLNDLFVIMNTCEEGVYDCYGNRFISETNEKRYFQPMEFHSDSFTSAWLVSQEWGWPHLKRLDFDKAWVWYESIGLLSSPMAKTPIQKAIFCIQSLCDGEWRATPSKLVELIQTLEALMKVPGIRIASMLSERLNLILGEPPSDKKWLSKVYEVRSKVVHGGSIGVRIGYHGDEVLDFIVSEYSWAIERTFAVLIALIQDMIENNGKGYDFKTIVSRI